MILNLFTSRFNRGKGRLESRHWSVTFLFKSRPYVTCCSDGMETRFPKIYFMGFESEITVQNHLTVLTVFDSKTTGSMRRIRTMKHHRMRRKRTQWLACTRLNCLRFVYCRTVEAEPCIH